MAYEGPQICLTLIAGESLTAKQYHFVKLSAANTVIACAALTDVPIGVLQNAPASGGEASVCLIGVTKIVGDADLTVGNPIGTSADAQADAKAAGEPTEYIVGYVIADNAAASGVITAVIDCAAARPAVTAN